MLHGINVGRFEDLASASLKPWYLRVPAHIRSRPPACRVGSDRKDPPTESSATASAEMSGAQDPLAYVHLAAIYS